MRRAIRLPTFIVAFLVLAGGAIGLPVAMRAMDVHYDKLPIQPENGLTLLTLPRVIPYGSTEPNWVFRGTDKAMKKSEVEELGTANAVSRWYMEADPAPGAEPRRFQLHCAYYTGMIDTVPHVPERCLVGAGIDMAGDSVRVDVPLDVNRMSPALDVDTERHGEILTMRSAEIPNPVRMPKGIRDLEMYVTPFRQPGGGQTIYAGYFFLANGEVVAQANEVRLKAFRLNDDYAYYMKVQFMSVDVASPEELGELAANVLNDLLPELMLRVPDWVDVAEGRWPPRDED